MKKIYSKKLLLVSLLLLGMGCITAFSQVNLTATAGTLTGSYVTLGDAFTAINAGTHQGAITIDITANTTELVPAILNSSGAGSASYTSVLIRPTVDGVVISGATTTGRGVIELKGADNVTIDGDNPNTAGINRNLGVVNLASNTITYTSCVRICNSAAVTSADNITIQNLVMVGSATGRNISSATSTTGSENTTFGFYAGGNGGTTSTDAPTAISSVTTNTSPSGTTINNLVLANCSIVACARGIVFNGAATSVSNSVSFMNNSIGDVSTTLTGTPPYTSPSTTVYTKGIWVAGTNSVVITGNTIQNILSYVGTGMAAIELSGTIGSGTITVNNNTISGVVLNLSSGNYCRGISVLSAAGPYTISGNTITNIQNYCSSTTSTNRPVGLYVATSATSAVIEKNIIRTVYDRNAGTYGVTGVWLNGGNNITLQNNFVSDINQDISGGLAFSTQYGIHGITIGSGTGHKIYNNSVHLFGAMLGTSTSSILTSSLTITGTGLTGLDVRNNILSNLLTGGTTSIANVSIWLPSGATSSMNLTLNNNAYYCGTDASRQGIGQAGTTAGTNFYLASNFNPAATTPANNMRTYTSTLSAAGTNDNLSIASTTAPPFVSNTDLHINLAASNITDLDGKAAVIAGLTTDIDGDTRNATTPDIGADEFVSVNCSVANGGTITPSSYNRCNGQTVTLTSTGATVGSGISYQWKVATTSGGPYVNVSGGSGATTTAYTSAALTPGTYYYVLETTCSFGPLTGLSNEVTVNVYAYPTASASSNTPVCEGGSLTLTGTTDVGTTFAWAGPNSFVSTSQNPTITGVTQLAAGIYTFIATANGCSSSPATTTVSILTTPTVSATTSDDTICQGGSVNLFSNSSSGAITLLSENFNSGASGWTTVNNSVGGTAPADAAWTLRPNGYTPGGTFTGSFSSNDNSQFFMTNSDVQGNGGTTFTYLYAPSINTMGYSSLSLQFYHHYNYYSQPDSAIVQASTDGVTWTTVQFYSGTDVGGQTSFAVANLNLNAYINNPNLYIRFYYHASWDFCWAIDNVKLTGVPDAFTYTWTSTPSGFTSSVQNPTSVSPSGTTTYEVSVTSPTGCSATSTVTVNVNPAPSLSGSITSVGCAGNDGAVDVTVTGGTPSYTYSWSSGQGTEDISGIAAGTYTVVVTDANTCSTMSSFVVGIQPGLIDIASIVPSDVTCNGGNNGSADLTTTGGTMPFTYSWSTSDITEDVSGLTAGIYSVTVTDDLGCTATGTVTVNEPTALALSTTGNNITCNGANNGDVDLTVGGGTPGYTYAWSNGDNTQDISGLAPATYSVTVTDNNGCTETTSYTITEPAALSSSHTETHVSCNGLSNGAVDLTASGGTPGYTYSWSNGATTQDISGLVQGTYNVTITDANGCTHTDAAVVTQPQVLIATASAVNVACFGESSGSANVDVNGGTSAYAYAWSNGAVTNPATGLSIGTYTVVVTDANGCTATSSVTITQPLMLIISPLNHTNVLCPGGSDGTALVSAGYGTPGYTYSWSPSGGTGASASGLSAGTYTTTVTDANGCTATTQIVITEPAAITATATTQDETSGNDGSINLTANGGTPGYSYNWSNGTTLEDPTGLAGGTYTVTITDNNGCTQSFSFTVNSQLGTEDLTGTGDINVYPNPSDGHINISVQTTGIQDVKLEVMDINGKLVVVKSMQNISDGMLIPMDLTGLSGGTYLLRMTGNKGAYTRRIVITK